MAKRVLPTYVTEIPKPKPSLYEEVVTEEEEAEEPEYYEEIFIEEEEEPQLAETRSPFLFALEQFGHAVYRNVAPINPFKMSEEATLVCGACLAGLAAEAVGVWYKHPLALFAHRLIPGVASSLIHFILHPKYITYSENRHEEAKKMSFLKRQQKFYDMYVRGTLTWAASIAFPLGFSAISHEVANYLEFADVKLPRAQYQFTLAVGLWTNLGPAIGEHLFTRWMSERLAKQGVKFTMRSILIGSIIAAWRFPKEIILRQSFKRAFLTCINAFLRSPVYTFMSENNPLAAIVMMFLQENTFYIHQGIGTDIVRVNGIADMLVWIVVFLVSLNVPSDSSRFIKFIKWLPKFLYRTWVAPLLENINQFSK